MNEWDIRQAKIRTLKSRLARVEDKLNDNTFALCREALLVEHEEIHNALKGA